MATSGTPLSANETDGFVPNGTVFDGRFRIEERVAEGGYAVVYKAMQVALERRVALKVLKMPRLPDERARAEFRDRFAAEAKTIALIRHPHIVDVYDYSVSTMGSGDLAPWMALEWLDGETVARFLKRHRQTGLTPRAAVDFLRPAIEAIAHAHSRGIVHRDIKPANIMVATTPKGTSLRVLDFGIAKIMSDDRLPVSGETRTEGIPAFSPFYAAPEQVTFSRTGPWTDVHALGLILTELMTGESVFEPQDTEGHVFELVMAPVRPTPSSRGRDAGEWEAIIAKAVALAPRDRWRNAGELLAALDRVQGEGLARGAGPRRRRARTLALVTAASGVVGALTFAARPLMHPRAVAAPPPAAIRASSDEAAHQTSSPIPAASTTPPAAASPATPVVPSTSSLAPPAARHPTVRHHATPKRQVTAEGAESSTPPKDPKPPVNDGSDLFNDTK